ncbi:MAG TPA: type II 3-dehydroquinate dehydratase [Candidatus Limnocylindrales bacterium]
MYRPVILVLNGPNLNLLGKREPGVYGKATLADAENLVSAKAGAYGIDIDFFQSNSEGALIDKLHSVYDTGAGIIINPGGLTSTSIALLDALLAVDLPTVEVHVTNIHAREPFRHVSYVSRAALAVIAGAGIAGYGFAVDVLADVLRSR